MSADPGASDPSGSARDAATPATSGFATPVVTQYTDDRKKWEWQSKFPADARKEMNFEAAVLIGAFLALLIVTGVSLALTSNAVSIPLPWLSSGSADEPPPSFNINFRILVLFFAGSIGGVSYSIKWLVHAAAKGWWHLDRRYWRLLTPFLGGVYACVILTFLDAGLLNGTPETAKPHSPALAAALAFLVGYFSDGVSGLLSNVANAVFGTLDKK